LPGQDTKAHAWDTRVGSIRQELQIWSKNPIFGEGFEAQLQEVSRGAIENTMAYFHNGWSSQLATTGLAGFGGFMCIIGTMFVVGRRLAMTSWDRGPLMLGA
jgi:O-antigen ligase